MDGEDDQEGERSGADLDVQDAASGGHVLVGGYVSTAVLSSAIGAAVAPWQAGVFRAAAWTACGLRVPARNALLADVVPAQVYGRAYGFEQAMDNLGAIGGPLGRLLAGVAAFEIGNRASTLLILRATDLFAPGTAAPLPRSSRCCCMWGTTWPPR